MQRLRFAEPLNRIYLFDRHFFFIFKRITCYRGYCFTFVSLSSYPLLVPVNHYSKIFLRKPCGGRPVVERNLKFVSNDDNVILIFAIFVLLCLSVLHQLVVAPIKIVNVLILCWFWVLSYNHYYEQNFLLTNLFYLFSFQ